MTSRIRVDEIVAGTASAVTVADDLIVTGTLTASGMYSPGGTDVAVADGGTGASTAADARTNLDVAQATNSLTAETAPAVDDLMPLWDVSASGDRKMRLDDMLKVVDSLTAHTAPIDSNKLLIYSGGAKAIRLDVLLQVINDMPADLTPAITDLVATYDTSAGVAKKVRLDDILSAIGGLPVESGPATNDLFAIYDASEGEANGLTLENMFYVINNLTEDTTPDGSADFVVTYDASGGGGSNAKKVKLTNIPPLGIPQNSQSAAYTTVLADANKHLLHPSSDNNPRTFTIDSNANVAYPIGTTLTFVNEINTVTIAITSDTLTMMGSGSTGSRTLAANGIATALKIASTKWVISGTNLS